MRSSDLRHDLVLPCPTGDSFHFQGTHANLFSEKLVDIDFASVMSVLPFDRLAIRNEGGRTWSRAEIGRAIAHIEADLEFDALAAGLQEDFTSGCYLFLYAKSPWWIRPKHRKMLSNNHLK